MREPVTPTEFQGPRQLTLPDFKDVPLLWTLILPRLESIYCMLNAPGTTEIDTLDVTAVKIAIRQPTMNAMATQVFNTGGNSAMIYEAGVIVCIVAPGESKTLPERGTLLIEANTFTGTTTLSITTSERSECGDIEPYVPAPAPIGAFLL